MIGFGSITWHGLTINLNSWNKLPKDVQPIVLEVAKEFEELTGSNNKDRYGKDVEKLKSLIKVKELPDAVRLEWANSLKDWPQATRESTGEAGPPGGAGAKPGARCRREARIQVAGSLQGHEVTRHLNMRSAGRD